MSAAAISRGARPSVRTTSTPRAGVRSLQRTRPRSLRPGFMTTVVSAGFNAGTRSSTATEPKPLAEILTRRRWPRASGRKASVQRPSRSVGGGNPIQDDRTVAPWIGRPDGSTTRNLTAGSGSRTKSSSATSSPARNPTSRLPGAPAPSCRALAPGGFAWTWTVVGSEDRAGIASMTKRPSEPVVTGRTCESPSART